MKKIFLLLIFTFALSCGRNGTDSGSKIITVSIAPFQYFVEQIAGNDFTINVMVPAGADPHTYEPFPEQIGKLSKSVAYISNGYLGFELNWLNRFYEVNPSMKRLNLGSVITMLSSGHKDGPGHQESADPHYWVSPVCALAIAKSLDELVCGLNPSQKEKYESNYLILISKIRQVDTLAKDLFSEHGSKVFMIYHPNLGYLARDYGLEEIPVEFEGKEPTASRMKELIDTGRKDRLKTIFVQAGYDTKNAKVIADEIGARIAVIDPLSEDWQKSTTGIIEALHESFLESSK